MIAAPRVQIIDYRLGNLFSIQQACQRVGIDAFVSDSTQTLSEVDGLILPGVGAFGDAMESLRELDLIEPLREAAAQGKPLMGICLGMQLLFEEHAQGLDQCDPFTAAARVTITWSVTPCAGLLAPAIPHR